MSDPRYEFQCLNARSPVLNVGCESDPVGFWRVPGTVNVDIDDWSGTTPNFRQMDACVAPWPFETGSFDTVVLSDCLDHMEDPRAALREARRVARRCIVVTLPAEAPTCEEGEHERHINDLKALGLKNTAPGDLRRRHAHFETWTPERVRALLGVEADHDLVRIPSGPPTDQHYYWGAVVRLDAGPHALPTENPAVSVLLCSYRPGGLDVALSGLAEQDYEGEIEILFMDELDREQTAVSSLPALRYLRNPRSVFPRCSTVTARNEAIVRARGDLAIWLTDYAAVPRDFVRQHVEAHRAFGRAGKFNEKVIVNGAFYNVWPPALSRRAAWPMLCQQFSKYQHNETLFARPLSAHEALRLPLQNRTHDGPHWTRGASGQDTASMHYPEGECGEGYFFMKHDSMWLSALREVGGLDESYLGLHKYDDSDIAARLALIGCRFYHSKAPAIRIVQMRHVIERLGMPNDAEERGLKLLADARARVAAGEHRPRLTHRDLGGAP